MSMGRSLFTLTAAHGYIYAIGGIVNGNIVTTSVERYDPVMNVWMAVPEMATPRSAAAAAVLNDDIFVIGGATKINSYETATVEKFDLKTESWTMVRKEELNLK